MTEQSIKVKICGVMDADTALVAASAGADFLGFIFVEGVRRQITVEQGMHIIENFRVNAPGGVKAVGVFSNQDCDWVNEMSDKIGLDVVQLCGDEDERYMARVNLPAIRQVRVRETHTADKIAYEVERHTSAGRLVLLEGFHPSAPGGSGIEWDWGKVRGIACTEGVFLSGGLSQNNVRQSIVSTDPWGVDVSSGVETNGKKNSDKIRDFIHAARTAHV